MNEGPSEFEYQTVTPLRDDDAQSDERLRMGAEWLRRVGPLEPSLARKHRVWLALPLEQHAASSLGSSLQNLLFALKGRSRMRLFAFSFALPMLAGAATTVVGFHYLSPSDPAISLSPQEPPSQPRSGAFQEDFAPKARMRTAEGSAVASPPAQERQKHSSRPEVAADEAADEPAALKAPRAGLREAERTGEPRVEEKKSKHHSSRSRSSKPRSASDENEAQLMLEALRARRGGDHERAARLLARYRKEHPQGSLSEEALALSLEAAVARGDHDQARRLAARYLELHPGGRFRSKAQKFVKTRP